MPEEKKYMTIVTLDGSLEKVEVLFTFELTDIKKEYVVYTDGEIDENGNGIVNFCEVTRREGQPPTIAGVTNLKEYYRVRNIVHKLAYGYGMVNTPGQLPANAEIPDKPKRFINLTLSDGSTIEVELLHRFSVYNKEYYLITTGGHNVSNYFFCRIDSTKNPMEYTWVIDPQEIAIVKRAVKELYNIDFD